MNETDKIINEHGNLTVEIITDEIIKQIEYCENKITENKKYETSEYIKFSYTFSLMRDGLELLLGSLYSRDLSIQCNKTRDYPHLKDCGTPNIHDN